MYRIEHQPLDNVHVVSPFGPRVLTVNGVRYWWHNGIDLRAVTGMPVYAVADGVVLEAKDNPAGYGLYVAIHHGGFGSLFAHLSRLCVQKGQQVKVGDIVGYSGNTGASTGPHLHFEIRLGSLADFWDRCATDRQVFMRCVDPVPFIEQLTERENLTVDAAAWALQKNVGLEAKTIDYLWRYYRHGDDLVKKLARLII